MTSAPRPLRIAQFVEALESGGAEALAAAVANELAARGHRSHLIVLRAGGAFENRLSADVIRHDLRRPRTDGSQARRLARFAASALALRSLLRAEGVEVLQTHLPKANFLGLAVSRLGCWQYFPTVHNNREFDYGDDTSGFKHHLRRHAYRRMLDHCSAMICVSDRVRTSLVTELRPTAAQASRFAVVMNGIRIPPPPDQARRESERFRLGVRPDQVLVVAVGRLTRQKNFAALLDGLAAVEAGAGGLKCVVAGEGELHDELAQLAAERGLAQCVTFAGLVQDVSSLFVAADIFCLPSLFEGLPLVLLEAMAASLPTVAFAIDGVVDVVGHDEEALLVPPGDHRALGSALLQLASSPQERRRLGDGARARVMARHDFGRMVDQLEESYGRVRSGARPGITAAQGD